MQTKFIVPSFTALEYCTWAHRYLYRFCTCTSMHGVFRGFTTPGYPGKVIKVAQVSAMLQSTMDTFHLGTFKLTKALYKSGKESQEDVWPPGPQSPTTCARHHRAACNEVPKILDQRLHPTHTARCQVHRPRHPAWRPPAIPTCLVSSAARPWASWALNVLLPTPPFPDSTRILCFTPFIFACISSSAATTRG